MQKMKTIDFEKEIFQTLKKVDENALSIFNLYSMMNSSHYWKCSRNHIEERSRIFEVNLFTNNIRLNHINFYSSELVDDVFYIPIDFEYDFNVGMETSHVVTYLFPTDGTELWKVLKYVAAKSFENADNIGFDFNLHWDEVEDACEHLSWLNDEDSIVKDGWFDNLLVSGGINQCLEIQ